MKKLHIIHAKTLQDVENLYRPKILPVLESHTLEWAKKNYIEAFEHTSKVKKDYEADPATTQNKYFKYLKRLLEVKLEAEEAPYQGAEKTSPPLPDDLAVPMQIESLRVPEYLSCTQLEMYDTCERKWYWRYLVGLKFPKTSALHFGTAVDEALNFYFSEKKNGNKAPREAVLASFYEHFHQNAELVDWGSDKPEILEKNARVIIDAYLDAFDDLTHPKEVQQNIKVAIGRNGLLIGAIDILEESAVVDTKTAKELWKTDGRYAKHVVALQPKAYSLWFYEEFKRMPEEFRYQIVTKETDINNRPIPKTQLIRFKPEKFKIFSFKEESSKIWDTIMDKLARGKEAFAPEAAKEKPAALCCEQYCEYAENCRKDGLKIAVRWDKAAKKLIYRPEDM